jgi:radical SAM superfamily enzyme YgiQ (UPF0313 family)
VTYLDKKFRIKTLEEIKKDVEVVKPYYSKTRRIFLADGNALIIPTHDLKDIINYLYEEFPKLERVGIYGAPKDILRKPIEDLELLKENGLGIVYLGVETGSDEVLKLVKKGVSAKEMAQAGKKVVDAGLLLSAIIILGLGGKRFTKTHGIETAKILNEMNPDYIGALTLMVVKGTELYEQVKRNEIELLIPKDILEELRILVDGLKVEDCVFRANHASNYLPFGGTLQADKTNILHRIDKVLKREHVDFKPEFLRGL